MIERDHVKSLHCMQLSANANTVARSLIAKLLTLASRHSSYCNNIFKLFKEPRFVHALTLKFGCCWDEI